MSIMFGNSIVTSESSVGIESIASSSANGKQINNNINKRSSKKSATDKSSSETKSKPQYKHIPHREKPAHLVARRNARERRRVQAVNSAFARLRKSVPFENRNKRLSKVKTLQKAIEYIESLTDVLMTGSSSTRSAFSFNAESMMSECSGVSDILPEDSSKEVTTAQSPSSHHSVNQTNPHVSIVSLPSINSDSHSSQLLWNNPCSVFSTPESTSSSSCSPSSPLTPTKLTPTNLTPSLPQKAMFQELAQVPWTPTFQPQQRGMSSNMYAEEVTPNPHHSHVGEASFYCKANDYNNGNASFCHHRLISPSNTSQINSYVHYL